MKKRGKIMESITLIDVMKKMKETKAVEDAQAFAYIVSRSEFLVPLTVTDDEKKTAIFKAVIDKDKKFLPIFTSLEELRKQYTVDDKNIVSKQDFNTIRKIVVNGNSKLDGLVIDTMGENVSVLRESLEEKK